jgi:peptidoglycan/LPS O-acetylase OafA/YrhL
MLSIKFHHLFFHSKEAFLISLFLLFVLSLKKISNIILIFQIQGFALFIMLVQIGKKIMKFRIKIIFVEISTLSYNIFLFHHKIIIDILNIINPTEWYLNMILLLIIIILTIILSKILYIIIKKILNSKCFKLFERILIKKINNKKY